MKRIIICLDGTWNFKASRRSDTNVAKLADLVRPVDDHGVSQISHYIEGIASTPSERAQFIRGAIGLGVRARIDKAFDALSNSYEPGDDVFLFGFSRGAFEARRLSGFIALFGIAKSTDFPFSKAWEIYRQKESKRDKAAIAELRGLAYFPVRIKCVGVWDTVGNLGNPFFSSGLLGRRYKLANTHPVDAIEVGLHALSVDEARGPFRPTLWTLPEGQSLPAHQTIEQVWFAGTHCDIGGGFSQTALSDIALRWMIERASAKTSLAFDPDKLAHMTRPDPLGAQHSSTTGAMFFWSGLFPFVRLVKQAVEAIPRWRRNLLGSWRSGKLPKGEASINETIHDSVAKRYGQRVIELAGTSARTIAYRPANLVPVLGEPTAAAAAAQKPAGALRRVKIYTVHGTFAHEAEWDNWLDSDDETAADDTRAFVHRLRQRLRTQGIEFDKLDHSQYEWSGGNSHEERRMAAVGLKKHIEADLDETYQKYGRDYYDGVYVIGHSHGGTVARLAMNLWDKDYDYYEPADEKEFVHDDKCITCMRARHGKVGPSKVPRPDGVITFGSPFVRFEPRRGGLLTAKIGVWVYRALFVIPLLILFAVWIDGSFSDQLADTAGNIQKAEAPDWTSVVYALLWPLAVYWALANFLPSMVLKRVEKKYGNGSALFALSSGFLVARIALLAMVIVYYGAYLYGGQPAVYDFLPFLKHPTLIATLEWVIPLALVWLAIVTLPSRFLTWIEHRVMTLRELLPRKFDPSEDRPVSYLSYHTLGDEAGLHLRIFGALTWLVQTLGLTAACVLAMGVILTPIIAVESLNHFVFSGSLLSQVGISALAEDPPKLRERFITLMDVLTAYPSAVWNGIFGSTTEFDLGDLPNAREVAYYIPMALAAAIWLVFIILMPFILIAITLLYLTSMWLRGSGVVFGSESMAWTMANRITVTRRANDNTMLRFLFISPEAWRRQEIAHCYYYKSARVIDDVASFITDWSRHKPSTWLNLERWLGSTARWLVVLLFCLSIFAVSVPAAQQMMAGFAGAGSPNEVSSQQPPPEALDPSGRCVTEQFKASGDFPGSLYGYSQPILRYEWQKQVAQKYASEWTQLQNAKDVVHNCSFGTECSLKASPCKPRPFEEIDSETSLRRTHVCKSLWHTVALQYPRPLNLTEAEWEKETAWQKEEQDLKARAQPVWEKEVAEKFGPEWANFTDIMLHCDRVPGDAINSCSVSAQPCKVNVPAAVPADNAPEATPPPATSPDTPPQPGGAP